MSFTNEDLLPLIFRFLAKAGYTKTALKLQKETDIDLATPVLYFDADSGFAQEETGFHRREVRDGQSVDCSDLDRRCVV